MTIEEIDKRIERLTKEAEILKGSHEATARRYQEHLNSTQIRFQQIRGAVTELEWVKNHLNGGSKP